MMVDFASAGVLVRAADFTIKYVPYLVKITAKFYVDMDRLDEVTYERLIVEKKEFPSKKVNLYSQSFLNQVIRTSIKVNRGAAKNRKKAKIRKPLRPEEKILREFHDTNHYRLDYYGTYCKNLPNSSYEEVTDSKIEDSIYRNLTQARVNNENSIYYLEGNIGCGKSTLLSTLFIRIEHDRINAIANKKKNTLPLDVCIVSFEDHVLEIDDCTSDDIQKLFENKIRSELLEQVDVTDYENLEDILKEASSKYRFILFIDGIDFLYTMFCKYCFELENKLSEYHIAFYNLILEFTNGKFSNLGINLIISLRNETLKAFRNTTEILSGIHRIEIPEERIYRLHDIPPDRLIEIFNKRLSIAYKHDEQSRSIAVSDNKYFEYYDDIAIHGLRHIMDAWEKSFGFIPLDEIGGRIYNNSRLFKLFFLASGVRHYSQINHGLTNLFLVNPNYRSERGDISMVSAADMDRPTYWLKYLLLIYIVENNADRNSIITLFRSRSEYSAELIRVILMGFSEVGHGRLLKPNVSGFDGETAEVVGLEASKRAIRSIQTGLFFSFEYLCCIVEDTFLRVPSSVLDSFKNPASLKFLTYEEEGKFERGKFEYLKEKAESVTTFLLVLEESYKIEKKRDPKLFKVFESNRYKKYIPDFPRMRNDMLIAFNELLDDASETQRKEVKDIIVSTLGLSRRELIRRSIFSTF